jgi:hypothetical protein
MYAGHFSWEQKSQQGWTQIGVIVTLSTSLFLKVFSMAPGQIGRLFPPATPVPQERSC